MGIVYAAFDPLFKRRVAIKSVLPPQSQGDMAWETIIQRMNREAEAAAKFSHPNVVQVYDIVHDPGTFSLVMELVEGKSLDGVYPYGALAPINEVLRIISQCASALDHIHTRGIVHRDVKLANIMLEDHSGAVKLMDFGIAKVFGHNTELTRGFVVGTVEYMSPEQADARPVDGRTDQYSLAAMAYRMLTGARIYDESTLTGWLRLLATEPPRPAHLRNPSLPASVTPVLERGMAKSPADRYETCQAFAAALAGAFSPDRDHGHERTAPLWGAGEGKGATVRIGEAQRKPGMAKGVALAIGGGVLLACLIAGVAVYASRARESTASSPAVERKSEPPAGNSPAASVVEVRPPGSPSPRQVWKNPKDGLEYVWVPAGTFRPGCVTGDNTCDEDEKPAAQQTRLDRGFWLGKSEVTVGAYRMFTQKSGAVMPPGPEFDANWRRDNHPIVNVTWNEAQSFCTWTGGRLPSGVEWEYAARAGIDGQRFTSGAAIDPKVANFNGADGYDNTSPAGSFPPNAWGFVDLSGNAAEWVADEDPAYPGRRVVRGGSWNVFAESLRLSKRVAVDATRRNFTFGFRCAL